MKKVHLLFGGLVTLVIVVVIFGSLALSADVPRESSIIVLDLSKIPFEQRPVWRKLIRQINLSQGIQDEAIRDNVD